jgi:sulfatase modifying factor 1
VSAFSLDKYLVTVGRFRQFVAAWDGGAGYTPQAGSGKHTHLNGGRGLSATGGGYEVGWVATDGSNIAPTTSNLTCEPNGATWTGAPGTQENLPINCVNWYEAYAFCIWDGGFLPSEAESEYAAAGGSEQREYPWGSMAPGTDNTYAIYDCNYPSKSFNCGAAAIAPVGFATLGAGLWGQLDLAGNVDEWNLDWGLVPAPYVNPCTDCVNLTSASPRAVRGGAFVYSASELRPSYVDAFSPLYRFEFVGVRCARSAP